MIGLSRPRRLGLWTLNLISIAFLTLPLVPVVLGSLQSEKSLQKDLRALVPSELTLANFKLILSGGRTKGPIFEQVTYLPKSVERFPTAFGNSLVVALAVTFTTLAAASLSAYTVARLRTRWTRALLQISLVSRMVPLVVLMVPLYVLFRSYGLLNSLTGDHRGRGRPAPAVRDPDPRALLRRVSLGSWKTPRASTAVPAGRRCSGSSCRSPPRAWPRAASFSSSCPGTSC